MSDMSREEFERLKKDSARRIREMYKGHNMPPYPDFIDLKGRVEEPPTPASDPPRPASSPAPQGPLPILGNLNIRSLTQNPDSLLILGLILLLAGEKADEKLLLALVFIML